MKPIVAIAGVAMATLLAGSTSAAMSSARSGAYAEPNQPVPYSQLGAYLKAPANKRMALLAGSSNAGGAESGSAATPSASGDAGASAGVGGANTGSDVNTSASTPSAPSMSMPSTAKPSTTAQPGADGSTNTGAGAATPPVNPPAGDQGEVNSPSRMATPNPQDTGGNATMPRSQP